MNELLNNRITLEQANQYEGANTSNFRVWLCSLFPNYMAILQAKKVMKKWKKYMKFLDDVEKQINESSYATRLNK